MPLPSPLSRFRGCLLGGAAGDALGTPVEQLSHAEICRQFGPDGLTGCAPACGRPGRITDGTQLSLFTAEGLIRSWVRLRLHRQTSYTGVTANAYLRWLATQGLTSVAIREPQTDAPGWLISHFGLHQQRNPGHTCLHALQTMPYLGAPASNDSKDCGGVMRSAPAGLFVWRLRGQAGLQDALTLGTGLAALTHGHPTGAVSGGALAMLILALADGASLPQALDATLAWLPLADGHQEVLAALQHAKTLVHSAQPPLEAIAALGHGHVAEEALAIAVYCALVAKDFAHGVLLAVNHDGNSGATGAITGNLLGTLLGEAAIPESWLAPLELRSVLAEIAGDLHAFADWDIGSAPAQAALTGWISRKYPGI